MESSAPANRWLRQQLMRASSIEGDDVATLMGIDFAALSLKDALDLAVLIEEEAKERYEDLAEQMELHHTPEAARFFRFMASNEEKHHAELGNEEVHHQRLVLAEMERTPPESALKHADVADEPVAQ